MTIKQVLIAIDQLGNTLLAGTPDETLSARAHRRAHASYRWRITEKMINGLFFWEPNHCFNAYRSEMERKQLPQEYRS